MNFWELDKMNLKDIAEQQVVFCVICLKAGMKFFNIPEFVIQDVYRYRRNPGLSGQRTGKGSLDKMV